MSCKFPIVKPKGARVALLVHLVDETYTRHALLVTSPHREGCACAYHSIPNGWGSLRRLRCAGIDLQGQVFQPLGTWTCPCSEGTPVEYALFFVQMSGISAGEIERINKCQTAHLRKNCHRSFVEIVLWDEFVLWCEENSLSMKAKELYENTLD